MGIRCTQWIGLSPAAEAMIAGESVLLYTEVGVRKYPDGREEPFERSTQGSSVETIESGRFAYGMFDEEIPLNNYRLPDGRLLEEHVQAEPWSSGPMIFTALKHNGEWVEESLWPEKEINLL